MKQKGITSHPPLIIVQNDRNGGYSSGNNVGIKFILQNLSPASEDFICILNNDVVVEPKFLTKFVEKFSREDEKTLLAGPLVLRYEDFEDYQRPEKYDLNPFLWILSRFIMMRRIKTPNLFSKSLYSLFWYTDFSESPVFLIQGSCLFFRKSYFEKFGLLDEATFLNFEENIIAHRIRQAGYRIKFYPDIKIYHKWGASTPPGEQMFEIYKKSAFYYFQKVKKSGRIGLTFLSLYFYLLKLKQKWRLVRDGK
jgi:GT2 family glycosyltransferase